MHQHLHCIYYILEQAVVGSSGCGKSTICRLLTRLYDVDSGSVTLDGVSLTELDPHWLRERIGIVEQGDSLYTEACFTVNTYIMIDYLLRNVAN
jgi:ABC-type bacteriocin/lantibiotic exporter with double-glycine peptidase domain